MVYKWNSGIGYFKVPAQTAGEELERIYAEHGTIAPKQIVNESRDEQAPLHPVFEWDDDIAAEKYRETQAGMLVRAIVQVEEDAEPEKALPVRAFVHIHTQENYKPYSIVVNIPEEMDILLEDAYRDLEKFRRKYGNLVQMRKVNDAIDETLRERA